MGEDVLPPTEPPPSVEPVNSMHRSGRAHDWRDFAKEVGIVVLGVLLALGTERVIRVIDQAHDAQETRAVAQREIAKGFGSAMTRLGAQDCVLRRLDEVSVVISRAGQADFVTPHWIGRPPFDAFDASGWNAAEQAGRTALIGEDERTRFGSAYGSLHRLNEIEQDEQRAWAELRQLEEAARLDPVTLGSLRSALQQARLLAWNARVTIIQGLQAAEKAGVTATLPPVNITSSACLPMTTARADGVARMNAMWGDDLGEP